MMNSIQDFSSYRIEREGMVICEPCLTISLFSDLDLRPAGSPSVSGPYDAFVRRFKNSLAFCRLDGNQMHFKAITSELLEKMPREMSDDRRRKKGGITAELNSGRARRERLAPALDFNYTHIGAPHTAIRIYLPLEWFSANSNEGLFGFLLELLADFPLQAGYIGYSFLYNDNFESDTEPYFFSWLRRHPGILEPAFSHSIVSQHGLTDLGWVTLLGESFVDRLGGAEFLRRATAHIEGVRYLDLPSGGFGIQLGDKPRLGDVANGDTMPDYQALGKVLAPLRNRLALHKGMAVAGFDDNQFPGLREMWIDRFFPE
jgi:hypothetical protein